MRRLNVLRRRWRVESILYCGLLTLTGSMLLTVGMHVAAGWPWWAGWVIGAVLGAAVLWRIPYWRMTVTDIARYLDRRIPELEESCGLLLRGPGELSLLERLQAGKVEERLDRVVAPDPLRKKLILGAGAVLLAVVLGLGVLAAGRRPERRPVISTKGRVVRREPAAPGIRGVRVRIVPPAYTGRPVREQADFGLKVEEDAVVSWELETDAAVDTVEFVFNDSTRVALRAADNGNTVWRFTEKARQSGFYQVRVGRRLSGLFQLEVLVDEPPQVAIRTPQPHTVVDYGDPTRIPLRVEVKDDYGITDASVIATVSSGEGEAVRFKQQELRWNEGFQGGRPEYSLSKVLDLGAMGLKPGDELYFYCRARDSRGQEGRTEIYIISLTDTAKLMSLEGITMSTDVKPEFFRSERQIIIETEQLLKQKDTMAAAGFEGKSNDLGIDQKLLRLRYGQFLGEEAEEGDQGEATGLGDTTDYGVIGDATRILQVITDEHDKAEDATYFELGIKQRLKATLNEMWNAELKLRTYHPQEALPFAYKALRLLKDLQQQSRVYVAKTGTRVTPLNPAKRLTGDLGSIRAPVQEAAEVVLPDGEVLRMALAVLESRRVGVGDSAVLRGAERKLGAAATAQPATYLIAYIELKKILEGGGGDVVAVERAIRKLVPEAEAAPGLERRAADGGLGKLYLEEVGQ